MHSKNTTERKLKTEPKLAKYFEGYEEEAEQAILLLEQILNDPEFIDNALTWSCRREQNEVKKMHAQLSAALAQKIKVPKKDLEKARAMEHIHDEHPDIEDPHIAQKRLHEAWGEQIQLARKELTQERAPLEVAGETYTYDTIDEKLGTLIRAEYMQKIQAMEEAIHEITQDMREAWAKLKEEFEANRDNPRFLNALAVWGRAPGIKKDRGPDGRGFHSGIVHYFQYRGDWHKAGRFYRDDLPLTLEGFMETSEQLREMINTPFPEQHSDVAKARLYTDEEEQRRLIMVSRHQTFISAFHEQGDSALRVVGIIPNIPEKFFETRFAPRELKTPDPVQTIGYLGAGRKEIDFTNYQSGLE